MHSAWAKRDIIFLSRNSHHSTLSPSTAETVSQHPKGAILWNTIHIDHLIVISNHHNCMVDLGWFAINSIVDASSVVHKAKRVGIDLHHNWSIGNC